MKTNKIYTIEEAGGIPTVFLSAPKTKKTNEKTPRKLFQYTPGLYGDALERKITVRFTKEDAAIIAEAVEARGETLSEVTRGLLLNWAHRQKKEPQGRKG